MIVSARTTCGADSHCLIDVGARYWLTCQVTCRQPSYQLDSWTTTAQHAGGHGAIWCLLCLLAVKHECHICSLRRPHFCQCSWVFHSAAESHYCWSLSLQRTYRYRQRHANRYNVFTDTAMPRVDITYRSNISDQAFPVDTRQARNSLPSAVQATPSVCQSMLSNKSLRQVSQPWLFTNEYWLCEVPLQRLRNNTHTFNGLFLGLPG